MLWALLAILTDGLVGLIDPNRVLPDLDFRLTSFGNPGVSEALCSTRFYVHDLLVNSFVCMK